MARKLLHGSISCFADLGDPNERYRKFLNIGRPAFKSFIESLILFDQVIIPTNDYMPLSLMLGVLGERTVLELLESEAIKFARFAGSIAYVGNGRGLMLTYIAIGKRMSEEFKSRSERSLQTGVHDPILDFDNAVRAGEMFPINWSADSHIAIHQAVTGVTGIKEERALQELSFRATVEIALGDLKQAVAGEISTNPALMKFRGRQDLDSLPGISPRSVRVLSALFDPDQKDDAAELMRIAQACIEASAATATGSDDICSSEQVSFLYQQAMKTRTVDGYVHLREIAGLVDAGELALQEKDFLTRLIHLRNTRSAEQFRSWFHENCRDADVREIAREYVGLIDVVPWLSGSMGRTMRFLTQFGLSVAAMTMNPVAGLAVGTFAGAVDSFILDRFAKRTSPKFFLDALKA